ncbi:hypothetical protein CM19_04890 [Candidatus Acidianus copahuensis]|uniref:Dihydrolipoyl dehydrogenase n=1 Tax=Candidatus Acidianus copahuensis TaxID=1160895 RepID=A0A031LQ00_9CREN|nr:dihydrolipoyl dehydrogenase [Candidatus Acidianus copahuensis]EZQ07086.1 hypothetical protein CM19_04890 [Candidatus Acidianus copahuensis]
MTDFDVIVLGGGGAGYTSAFELSRGGMKVLLTEPKGVLGGNCLYEGCIPSKTYWHGSHFLDSSKRLSFLKTEVSFSKLVDWKDQVQERRFKQHSEELRTYNNVTFIPKEGEVIDKNHVKIEDKTYSTKYIVIATGAYPYIPEGFEGGITTHELLMPGTKVRELPEKLAIIGGGYIGVEMASIFAKLGSKVTLFGARILPETSKEVQDLLEKTLNSLGVEIVKERCAGLKLENEKKSVFTTNGKRGEFDEALIATGRRPNTALIHGISLGKKGEIETTHGMKTMIDNVYAPGDVNGKYMLFHVAVLEGWITAQNILEGNREVVQMDYNAVPFAVYSTPQVAWTGMWKEDAIKKGYDVETRRFNLAQDARDQIEGFDEGWIEIVIERGSQRILGAQVIGEDADMLIGELALAVGERLTTYDIARLSQPHPTPLEELTLLMRKATKINTP